MSFTFGFYNSLNGDRKYNATQLAKIFDGIINDGILMSVGSNFVVTANSGMNVNVGTGRAWFNHTWSLNDAVLVLTIDTAEIILDRIDTVVLEIDARSSSRANSVKIIKGTPASSPVPATLSNSDDLYQYPLAYIYVASGVTEILTENITNKVGTVDTPFATGVMATVTIDDFVAQWGAEFNTWFSTIQDILDENVAGNLQNQINDINDEITIINNTITIINNKLLTTTGNYTLLSANWSGASAPYTYVLSVEGVTATSNQELLPSLSITANELKALQKANIIDGGQNTNSITLLAFGTTKPSIDLPIRIMKRGEK